jgi:3-hydroxy-9,10-secoandrosta-1,3,5(10)-triene-9,17-dione monooxygenase reductase component
MESGTNTTAYRDAIGHFTTGVAVVTSVGENGPSGLTASAVASLSLDPLLMLVCLDRDSRTLRAIESSGRLAVNVLARGQEALAHGFAGKGPEREKFSGVSWRDREGLPELDGIVAWLAGDVTQLIPGGDHLIAIAAVTHVDAPGGDPLVYFRGSFRSLDEGGPA